MCRRHTGTIFGVHRAEAPAIESTVRRSRTAAEPPSRSRLLGPERSREQETNSECIQLPETGPQGRIYRQLGDGAHAEGNCGSAHRPLRPGGRSGCRMSVTSAPSGVPDWSLGWPSMIR